MLIDMYFFDVCHISDDTDVIFVLTRNAIPCIHNHEISIFNSLTVYFGVIHGIADCTDDKEILPGSW